MTKLNDKEIHHVALLYARGVHVRDIAGTYNISIKSVYNYVALINQTKKVAKPTCYKDYLINSIIHIEEKIRNGKYEPENVQFAKSEIARLRRSLKQPITHMQQDAFIIQ